MSWYLFNNIIGPLGLVIGIIGIILSLKARNLKKPKFIYQFATLQTQSHPDVQILFKGQNVTRLYKLVCLFWNAGNQPIHGKDVPKGGRPYIHLLKGDILSYSLRATSSKTIGFRIDEKPDRLEFDFKYLNPGDGAVIEILYGWKLLNPPGSGSHVDFGGTLIGANSIGFNPYIGEGSFKKFEIFFMVILGFFVIAAGTILLYLRSVVSICRLLFLILGVSLLAIGTLVLFSLSWLKTARRFPEFAKPFFEWPKQKK